MKRKNKKKEDPKEEEKNVESREELLPSNSVNEGSESKHTSHEEKHKAGGKGEAKPVTPEEEEENLEIEEEDDDIY